MGLSNSPPELIGQSPAFLGTLEQASQIAMIDRPVIVTGERGSGKSTLSARMHYLSPRWEGPLVKLNCAEMDARQLETALFGSVTGSVTGGAVRRSPGAIQRAEGGTLFLDHIEKASLHVQSKILRLIESGSYEHFNDENSQQTDIRIIAATDCDLRLLAQTGEFCADLLDMLALSVIELPPLRERHDDIPMLAAHFASPAVSELGFRFPDFSAEALIALKAHDWPGNIRELKTVSERAAFRWGEGEGQGKIHEIIIDPLAQSFGPRRKLMKSPQSEKEGFTPSDISTLSAPYQEGSDLRAYLSALEKTIVAETLARNGQNQRRAADALSLTYDQMRGIVKKHGL
ncbi:sigma 54-interacting transcriptional regulator [Hyphococcus flavus]|uniref:Sigma 54-interacting transcriptional regulator n=1 Tax=Hyphococcus flavus TaxID=1866326 RepID=A0AAE9ZI50_9PROT|nr:sigma 54-interacting transcriptional regulator [Hyphococcus flavus]WDI31326.1 sigma 54-interacting transcriptional regulator [Hyphococcus flavus]